MAKAKQGLRITQIQSSGVQSNQDFLKTQQFLRSPEYVAKKRAQMEQNDLRPQRARSENALRRSNVQPSKPNTQPSPNGERRK